MFRRLISYVRGSIEELTKVIWPTRRDVINHTFVITMVVLTSLILFGFLDYGLTELLRIAILNQK